MYTDTGENIHCYIWSFKYFEVEPTKTESKNSKNGAQKRNVYEII